MTTKAGVWVDKKHATVVLVTDAGQEIKRFKTSIEQADRPTGSRSQHTYTHNDFIAEDRRERRLVGDRKKEYDEVIAYLRGATAVLILGPGEAKSEFIKYLKSKKLRVLTLEKETTDKMTDRQLAAKVVEHFAGAPTSKSVAPKKTAKAMSRNRSKKARK